MNIEPRQQQAYHLGEVAQHATASTPFMRFVPAAAVVSDQTVDQWVEQELKRGRRRVRAGLAMLAILAMVAIPLVLLVR
jgi:hypothetical protein